MEEELKEQIRPNKQKNKTDKTNTMETQKTKTT